MKKLLVAMLGAVLVLGACGGNGDEPAPADDTNGTEETAGGDVDVTYDAANGEEVYQGRCAACHGGDLQGASGPGIVGLTYDEVLTAIQEGPGGMPADLATGQDAEDVAAWVVDQN
ncbi:MAG: cytochrome c [Bacillus sp. (in: Bacteria)]|nr:cytochrome c [Bacillus sp. (in: firmicutes)]